MSLCQMIVNWEKTVDLKGCEWKFGQFVVRVLRDDEKDEALDLIRENLRDDPIVSELGFDNASMDSIVKIINKHNQNITFGCFTKKKRINVKSQTTPSTSKLDQNDTPSTSKMQQEEWTEPKLVAVDTLYVRNIRDKYPELSEESDKVFIKWLTYTKKIEKLIWTMGDRKICNILTSFGVFVSKEYKDKGIPREMIKHRKTLATKLMIDVTGAAIIGKDEQLNAENNNYEIIHVLNKEELGLDNSSSADLETIFPIVVMGFKKVCRKKRRIADVRNPKKRRNTGYN